MVKHAGCVLPADRTGLGIARILRGHRCVCRVTIRGSSDEVLLRVATWFADTFASMFYRLAMKCHLPRCNLKAVERTTAKSQMLRLTDTLRL